MDKNVERRKQRDAAWMVAHRDRVKASINQSHQKLRNDFFTIYGSKCSCPGCNETNRMFLTLDHINNDGHKAKSQGKQNLHIYRDAVNEYRPDLFRSMCFNCNCGRYRNNGKCPHFGLDANTTSRNTNKSKISNEQVAMIRNRYRPWDRSNSVQALSKEFGVCPETIERIVLPSWQDKNRKKALAQKAKLRRQILYDKFFEMYGCKCACSGCGEENKGFLTLDHIIGNCNLPVEKRKTGPRAYKEAIEEYKPDLYQVLCYNCNCAKNRNEESCPHLGIKEKKNLELNEKNKLTIEQVKKIRATHKQYNRTCGTRAFARQYDVCTQTIEDVIYNRSWKDV